MKKTNLTKENLDAFLAEKSFALVGVPRDPKKFGYHAFTSLVDHKMNIIPVNPQMTMVDDKPCYPDLSTIPETPGAVISMVPQDQTLSVLMEADKLGIKNIWIQMKSDSPEAIQYAHDKNMNVIFGECILMYVKPVTSFHAFHRFLRKLFGSLPVS